MFNSLISRLSGRTAPAPNPKPDPELDRHAAMVALLVRLARADSDYAFEEIAEIDRIATRTWQLSPVDAMKLRARAEAIDAEAPDTRTLIEAVQAETPYAERVALLDALRDVSMADSTLHENERHFLEEITAAFGITPEDARTPAERRGTGAAVNGYWIGRMDVRDDEAYKRYVAANAQAFARFGGRFIVRGGPYTAAEGSARSRNVVIEFPSLEAAEACYHSPEYQAAKRLRDPVATGDLIIIGGYGGPQPGE